MSDVIETVYTPGALRTSVVLRVFRQVVLPPLDALFVAFGLASFVVGSKIVEDFIFPEVRPLWATVVTLGATGALCGNVFLWKRIEFFSRLAFLAGMALYAVATVGYMVRGNDSAVLTLLFAAGRMLATVWRMWWIALDIGKEEADHEVIVARTGGTPTA